MSGPSEPHEKKTIIFLFLPFKIIIIVTHLLLLVHITQSHNAKQKNAFQENLICFILYLAFNSTLLYHYCKQNLKILRIGFKICFLRYVIFFKQ